MRLLKRTPVGLCLLLLLALPSVASAAGGGVVVGGWLRELPPVQETGIAYLWLRNEAVTVRTIRQVRSPVAGRIEIHRHEAGEGMMRMRRVDSLSIGPGELVRFAPGGYHLMLFGLQASLRAGEQVPVSVEFDDGSHVDVSLPVLRIGQEAAYQQELQENLGAAQTD